MSEKNKLQEFCTAHKLPTPVYTSRSSGDDHRPHWQANVSLLVNANNLIFESPPGWKNKTTAEKYAAGLLLDHLTKNLDIITTVKAPSIVEKIYLLDLENRPCLGTIYHQNTLYIGFINAVHQTLPKYDNWYRCQSDDINYEVNKSNNNRLLFVSAGGVNDLSDHFMTFMAYPVIDFIQTRFIKYQIYAKIYIVSGDHAGWCTRHCLQQILTWRKISGIEIDNVPNI
jgi:hypothetical protein